MCRRKRFCEFLAWLRYSQAEYRSSATRNPYYVAQRMIVLGRTDSLLNQFADRLAGLVESVSEELVTVNCAQSQLTYEAD